jgi:hypothetical protein
MCDNHLRLGRNVMPAKTSLGISRILSVLIGGILLGSCSGAAVPGNQRELSLVKRMPALPQPYHMRDWRAVSDKLYNVLFNPQSHGAYLPLIHILRDSNGRADSFILPAYVSRIRDTRTSAQALTDMGAVWGATLVGRNMSQGSINYVRLLERFFDPSVARGLFGNNFQSASPQATAWYTVFPDITAMAISTRYPADRKFANMCRTTAQSWAEAIPHFRKPDGAYDFNYTGFDFSTMRPAYNGKWREPDMAGGLAWLEYMAWRRWHHPAFLKAAKACMQYLSTLRRADNPSYEVLTPFGAMAAVRMNAELQTHYPVQKFLHWCFSRYAARPTWGMEAARWGDQDVSGLVGAVNCAPWRPWGTGGYAFFMETSTQLWALAPVARYDQRYALAIGKWILNASNACRLFYGKFHSAVRQSDPGWLLGKSLIVYEGLKYRRDNPHQPLIATGDAKTFLDPGYPGSRQTGITNYCLYGGVYAGVLGALVQKTNVRGILQINLRATDTLPVPGYPTFLFYNPYPAAKTVSINVGAKALNLYNTVTGEFFARNVRGKAMISIPGRAAAVIVYTPARGTTTYREHETLLDGMVIDFRHGKPSI